MFQKFLTGAVVGAAIVSLATSVYAAPKYPDAEVPRTVRVIVAYNAGGSSDALARVTLPYWEKAVEELTGTKPNAIVVNLPGAGGQIGWTALAHAQADGSTFGVINLPAVPLVEKARKADYAPWLEKFTALGVDVIDPNVVRLSVKSKHKTMKDAIEAAKAKPGSVTIGADGPLSDDQLAMYALSKATGATFTFIPFAGGSPSNRAFLAGEVDISIGNVFDHIKTKDAASEAMVLRPTRYDFIPDVPTAQELIGTDVGDLGSTRGFAAPSGTPDDLVEVYREAFALVFANADFLKEARERNITLVEPRVGDAFTATMQAQEAATADLLDMFVEGGFIKK